MTRDTKSPKGYSKKAFFDVDQTLSLTHLQYSHSRNSSSPPTPVSPSRASTTVRCTSSDASALLEDGRSPCSNAGIDL